MSKLQKMISRLGRHEGPGIGFGLAAREQPRAMLLAVLATDAETAKAQLAAGADIAIACAADGAAVRGTIEGLASKETTVGAWVSAIDEAGAETLKAAGCDFVISTLDGTRAEAFDSDRLGQVLAVDGKMDDTTLRALAPLGIDGLFVERPAAAMTLGSQLELVRLATFSNSPLLVTIAPEAPAAELRVLRDSGVAVVVAPEATTPAQTGELVARLKAVPPKRARREGREVALVPAVVSTFVDEEEVEEPEEE